MKPSIEIPGQLEPVRVTIWAKTYGGWAAHREVHGDCYSVTWIDNGLRLPEDFTGELTHYEALSVAAALDSNGILPGKTLEDRFIMEAVIGKAIDQ